MFLTTVRLRIRSITTLPEPNIWYAAQPRFHVQSERRGPCQKQRERHHSIPYQPPGNGCSGDTIKREGMNRNPCLRPIRPGNGRVCSFRIFLGKQEEWDPSGLVAWMYGFDPVQTTVQSPVCLCRLYGTDRRGLRRHGEGGQFRGILPQSWNPISDGMKQLVQVIQSIDCIFCYTLYLYNPISYYTLPRPSPYHIITPQHTPQSPQLDSTLSSETFNQSTLQRTHRLSPRPSNKVKDVYRQL